MPKIGLSTCGTSTFGHCHAEPDVSGNDAFGVQKRSPNNSKSRSNSKGNSHRLVLAFDTLLTPRLPGQPYTAPEEVSDATETVFFGFCADHRRNSGFMALPWVAGWLRAGATAGEPDVILLTPGKARVALMLALALQSSEDS